MNSFLILIKKNIDVLIVFILSVFLFAGYFVDICSLYLSYGKLDLEYYLLSDFGFLKHLIPNKDFIYPYGIIQYYRFENLLTLFFYYLILPLLFTAIYFLLKKVIKEKAFLYFSVVFIFIFLLKISGFNTFWRYGVLVVLSMLFAYCVYNQKILSKRILLGMGFVLGIVFSLINDQGTYLILTFMPLYFLNDAIRYKKNTFISIQYYKNTLSNFLFIALGFLLGLAPLIIYLIQNNAVEGYLRYFSDLSNLIVALKTPFFNFVTTRDNLFTIMLLSVTLFYLAVKFIYFRSKINLIYYYQLSLSLSILCMEQKNIIRSISSQITFVTFLLLVLLLYELITSNKYFNSYKKTIIFSAVLFVIVFLGGLTRNNLSNATIPEIARNIKMSISEGCYVNNINTFSSKNPEYITIINKVKNRTDFNGKIFSFPSGDSTFYILLNQIPPFYNSLASDSPLYAQENTIQYIKNNHIQYATLYYADPESILDSVPSYVRQATELKYLLTNFYPIDTAKDHLILIKKDNSDFLKSPLLASIQQYKNSLLNVYLGMVPYSEGMYKYKPISGNKPLIGTSSQAKLNEYLKTKKISSKNKVIILIPSINSKNGTLDSLKITADGIESNIYFNSCKIGKPCIINLSNIPLFYKNRIIEKIQLDKNFRGEIRIIELNNFGNLW